MVLDQRMVLSKSLSAGTLHSRLNHLLALKSLEDEDAQRVLPHPPPEVLKLEPTPTRILPLWTVLLKILLAFLVPLACTVREK